MIGVGVIDPWMNLVFTVFPLCFFTVIRWFIVLAAMHQSPQLFLSPTHLTAVLVLLLVAVWFYHYYVFIYSSCASPFTFLKALESSSRRKSSPDHGPKCAAGH